jgi:hypothetical protein
MWHLWHYSCRTLLEVAGCVGSDGCSCISVQEAWLEVCVAELLCVLQKELRIAGSGTAAWSQNPCLHPAAAAFPLLQALHVQGCGGCWRLLL